MFWFRLPMLLDRGPGAESRSHSSSWELERLSLIFQDVHPIRFDTEAEKESVIGGILNSLTDALARCRGPEDTWRHRNFQRAIVLIGGLDEVAVVKILAQEGV